MIRIALEQTCACGSVSKAEATFGEKETFAVSDDKFNSWVTSLALKVGCGCGYTYEQKEPKR